MLWTASSMNGPGVWPWAHDSSSAWTCRVCGGLTTDVHKLQVALRSSSDIGELDPNLE